MCGPWAEHFGAQAIWKRSSNRIANCALAMAHSRGGILHSLSARFKTRNRSLRALSSLGKCPRVLTARRRTLGRRSHGRPDEQESSTRQRKVTGHLGTGSYPAPPENDAWTQETTRAEADGGEEGIRTPGSLSTSTVFKTAALNHSATSPHGTCLTGQSPGAGYQFTTGLRNLWAWSG